VGGIDCKIIPHYDELLDDVDKLDDELDDELVEWVLELEEEELEDDELVLVLVTRVTSPFTTVTPFPSSVKK
jgi:hypothetical protein